MEKTSIDVTKMFIPHPMQLFILGTYKEDGKANLGLFCWLNFCWDDELSVMVCLDGNKLTKDIIKETGVFSANLVTETILPIADYLGHKNGYDGKEITKLAELIPGEVLNVPILQESPMSYELEVKKTIALNGSDIFICRIANTLASNEIVVDSHQHRLEKESPALVSQNSYYGLEKKGNLGDWKYTGLDE
ncbi:MAG: flavin reductase [Acetobacterium sp.]|nr:flavin reductase [uncultured Acetobacterium sp.]MBU4439957.1 flavin reductase [Bacillota bacterium]MCG2730485.1 flavin reductase [Acetobacterium sp.]